MINRKILPLHWEDRTHKDDPTTGSFNLYSSDGKWVASVMPYGGESFLENKEAKELTELIVRACNNHDKLITALKDACEVLTGENMEDAFDVYTRGHKAIGAAKEPTS